MNHNYLVIMAGGVGSRFWPFSRTQKPKQFLDILGTGKTLIQQTIERFESICPVENVYIVTNEIYKETIIEQVPGLPEEQILLEPYRRNTAPCIAYANYRIAKKDPEANIIVAPADHLILNKTEFIRIINQGLHFVQNKDVLLTLGIKPSRPETGYGYIQVNDKIEDETIPELGKVKTFTEKPNLEMAKVFYESGEFFWNSGLFLWSLKAINKAFEKHLAEVDSLFKEIDSKLCTPEEEQAINKTYQACKNISIDYGVMEKAKNVYVLRSDFGWSDLGTWGSLYEHIDHDGNKNAIQSDRVFSYETKSSIIKAPKDKLVVVQGLKDYIVVDTDDALLIVKKDQEQRIKDFVNDVKLKNGDHFI